MQRLYPKLVTLLGGVGLGLALTYIIGVILAFIPGWEDWAEFFVPLAIPLLIPPYLLLVVHLVLRNHVGRFLLGKMAFEEAAEYAGKRMNASVLRSRREVANQRIVNARAHIGMGDYEKARQLLDEHDDWPGSYKMESRRWLCELALRDDDRKLAGQYVVDTPSDHDASRGHLAAILGCGAELALRDDDRAGYEEQMEYALWEDGSHWRVRLARALAMLNFELGGEDTTEVAELFEELEEPAGKRIPAWRSELKALRALAARRGGDDERARQLLDEAADGPQDTWSRNVLEHATTSSTEAPSRS